MYTKGYAAPEVRDVYERAYRLSEKAGASTQRFQALSGISTYYMARGELSRALELSDEMMNLAEAAGEPGAVIEAHRLVALNAAWSGQFERAVAHSDNVRQLFDPARDRGLALTYGQDHMMSACVFTAQAKAALGYPRQAEFWRQTALAEAQKTNSHFGRAYARSLPLITLQYLRDLECMRTAIADAIAYSTEQSLIFWRVVAGLFEGWVLLQEGNIDGAITRMREGIQAYRFTGADVQMPHINTLLAEALTLKGATSEAIDLLDQALEDTSRKGERHYEAETNRVKGDVLLKGKNDPDGAEECYLISLAVAREQEAKLFELRTATSLARLWLRSGKRDEAWEVLSGVHAWFTEGSEAADLRDARRTLDELQGTAAAPLRRRPS
jgi:adenylate cyclase